MRRLTAILFILSTIAYSQKKDNILAGNNIDSLKVIYVNKDISTHFMSLEDITYADISVPSIIGDLAQNNILRVKPTKEGQNGVITIITERFMTQYLLVYTPDISKAYTRYTIPYEDVTSYLNPEVSMTKSEMYDWCYKMVVSDKKYYDVSTKDKLMTVTLNNIYTLNKYFFIDLSIFNKTNIQFDIDQIRFKIEDKRQVKATNVQSVEIFPIVQLNDNKNFKKNYRNIFVFDKFTFPGDKVLSIEIYEKQISGRKITLRIDYSDVLHADNFIND